MGDVVERMLGGAMEVFRTDDRKLLAQIERMDNDVDALHGAIKMYLTELMRHGLSDEDSRRCVNMLAFTGNLEHIGDIIDQNLMQKASKKIKNKLAFSREGFEEITALHRRVLRNLNLALGVFVSGDVKVARELLAEKVAIRSMELAAAEGHLGRLREGYRETMETTTLHMDIVRDLKRINSHLTSVAYPILEEAGVLLKSRLRDEREGASSLDSLPS
jgi:phosphate:Na+ symporter